MTEDGDQISQELDALLKELSWQQLQQIIRDFKKSLHERITAGGIRLQPKNRKWILPIVKHECLLNEDVRYSLFSVWFNQQQEYYDCLNPFFESSEHEELLKELKVDDNRYVISHSYFAEFLLLVRPDDVSKFLRISPVKFTPFQQKMLAGVGAKHEDGSIDSQENEEQEDQSRKLSSKDIVLTKKEWKKHQKELRKCQQEQDKLKKENRKLHKKIQDSRTVRTDCQNQLTRLESLHAEKVEELLSQHDRLQACIEALKREAVSAEKQLKEKEQHVTNLDRKLSRLQSESDLLFQKVAGGIDSEDLLAGLNAQGDVLELLSTVIRPPSTDNLEESSQAASLQEFWHGLATREKDLVENILNLTVKNATCDDFFNDWADRVDDFNDLKCSLMARHYLVDMFYEVLLQAYKRQD